jgi:membrane protein implicated in regulation of membrane protease activity
MNVLNRILVVLGLMASILFWILAAVFVVFYPFLDKAFLRGIGEALVALSSSLPLTALGVIVFAIFSVIMVIVLLVLLWLEIMPPRSKTVRVGNGSTVLTIQAVAQRVQFEAEHVDDVAQARPRVRSRGKSVDVILDVRTRPDVAVAAKSEEISRRVRESLENDLGVKVNTLEIDLHLDPKAHVANRSAAAASVPAAATGTGVASEQREDAL